VAFTTGALGASLLASTLTELGLDGLTELVGSTLALGGVFSAALGSGTTGLGLGFTGIATGFGAGAGVVGVAGLAGLGLAAGVPVSQDRSKFLKGSFKNKMATMSPKITTTTIKPPKDDLFFALGRRVVFLEGESDCVVRFIIIKLSAKLAPSYNPGTVLFDRMHRDYIS
jgi:hypothetical protein